MNAKLVVKEVRIDLTDDQKRKVLQAFNEASQDRGREFLGVIAFQPLVKVGGADPTLKVSILTPEFTEKLFRFLEQSAKEAHGTERNAV